MSKFKKGDKVYLNFPIRMAEDEVILDVNVKDWESIFEGKYMVFNHYNSIAYSQKLYDTSDKTCTISIPGDAEDRWDIPVRYIKPKKLPKMGLGKTNRLGDFPRKKEA